ncbi:MAG: 1-deoxy-D-xylulose-5-phosphate reductoisomerase [Bacteroidota bacterium]|nr:1-deoxy-D-xylulose-5-phosphate reductoisomerase [Bacteroidota bacterium]
MKKGIAILGSTGSIGVQALEVISANPDKFNVEVLTARKNVDLLIQQSARHKPKAIVIDDEKLKKTVSDALSGLSIKVFAGKDALSEIVQMPSIDIVLTAIVGFAGLLPTVKAIEAKKDIALANKETLVVAGELITQKAHEHSVQIIPVDSEHSAIFQCLVGEEDNPIEKIYLTASGGPFRGKNKHFLSSVTKHEALNHPNWDMGNKITIDSASLMNKGLEVIEAKWLFALEPDQIDVIVHPQSIIHSIVQFSDGSMKAQMGLPDMRLPIQYALSYPKRIKSDLKRFSFLKYPRLTFEQPDRKNFRNLDLAYNAMRRGGNSPCVLNAANEIVVDAFLNDRLSFTQMSDIIESVLQESVFINKPSLQDYIFSNEEARQLAIRCLSAK